MSGGMVVDYATKKELVFEPCKQCGVQQTNLEDGLCWDCENKARTEGRLDAIRDDRQGTLVACGVPKRFARIPFQEPLHSITDPRRPDIDILKAWPPSTGDPWAITLGGPVGTGKTVTSCEKLFRWRCTGRDGYFVRATQVPEAYFTTGKAPTRGYLERMPLLILDDVGRGHLGRAWEAVGELLAYRHAEELPTVVTTNLGLREIADHDAHIADRLTEGLVIHLGGDSRRDLDRRTR